MSDDKDDTDNNTCRDLEHNVELPPHVDDNELKTLTGRFSYVINIKGEADKREFLALRQRSFREPGSTASKVIVARPTVKSNFQLSNFQ